jgi:hypothetical protein
MANAIAIRPVTAPRILVRGNYWLTQQQFADFLEASQKHRDQLKVAVKARTHAVVLTDDDFDGIAGDMEQWRTRWLKAATR